MKIIYPTQSEGRILRRYGTYFTISMLIFLSISIVAIAEELRVSTDRYSLFAPWTNKVSSASLSSDFKAYALLLDNNGKPISGANITFEIYSPAGRKTTKYNSTLKNGLASVSYDTISDFTSSTDTDYGTWTIKAILTGNPAINKSTDMLMESGGSVQTGCNKDYCHSTNTITGAKPLSPYTDGYGSEKTRVVAAHKKKTHDKGCFVCHPGYAATKTGNGYTGDVHKNRTCDYCHGDFTYFSGTGNGIAKMPGCTDCHPVYNSNVKNIRTLANLAAGNNISVYSYNYDTKTPLAAHNGTTYILANSVPCIVCHGPAHNNTKPYVSAGNSITENEQCWTCHTNRATTHKLNTNCVSCHTQDAHNVSIIAGGGPDCLSCHNTGGSAAGFIVDGNAMNSGVHANLNSGAAAGPGIPVANKKCWGCHQTGGNQPADMGDRYRDPYKCYDCHNATKPYPGVNNALTVNEHFKNGTDIKAAISAISDSISCIACHNLSEMKVSYTDNEFTQFSLASHYGKNRSDLRVSGSTECGYCHQNGSTVFSGAMANVNNKNVSNHSVTPAPGCTNATCHGSGKLHDSSLNKPVSSDALCKNCHTSRSEHKALYCTECHANNTDGSRAGRDIHGIKFLQKDNTFSRSRTNAADCTTCHQSNVVDSSLGTFTAEKIGELHHSNNITNGTRWGNYWTTDISACLYCHNDTRHNSTPLGRPLMWNSSYQMKTAIGSGTNCADCHFNGDTNYGRMSSTFATAGLQIPPEITNGSWNGKPGYYNHTLSDYTDSRCQECHDRSGSTTMDQFTHDVSEGTSGGPDCRSCHDVGGSAPGLINFSAMNISSAAHRNLNSGASSTVDIENKKCWACHGSGTQPAGHPSNYRTPLSCTTCHTGAGSYNAPKVAEHNQVGLDVRTAVNCTQCHDNNGMYLTGTGAGSVVHYFKDVTDTATRPYGHFGPIDTSNCINCHSGPNTGDQDWGSPVNISTSTKRTHNETLTAQCDACHKDASVSTLADVDFHDAAITPGAGGDNCLGCHAFEE